MSDEIVYVPAEKCAAMSADAMDTAKRFLMAVNARGVPLTFRDLQQAMLDSWSRLAVKMAMKDWLAGWPDGLDSSMETVVMERMGLRALWNSWGRDLAERN